MAAFNCIPDIPLVPGFVPTKTEISTPTISVPITPVKSEASSSTPTKSVNKSYSSYNLPQPSEEQQLVIDTFTQGYNIKIKAVAGGGKTTTLLHLATAAINLNPSQRVLILTYNKSLQIEVDEKVKKLGLGQSVHVYTFHAFASMMFQASIWNDKLLREALYKVGSFGFSVPQYGTILIDEVQDMSPDFNQLVNIILKGQSSNSTGNKVLDRYTNRIFKSSAATTVASATSSSESINQSQIVIVGDPRQCINQYMGSDLCYFTTPEKYFGVLSGSHATTRAREWRTLSLRTTFRLTPATANFVNRHALHDELLIGGNLTSPNLQPIYIVGSYSINKFVDTAVKEYGHSNVMIICPSVKKTIIGNTRTPLGNFIDKKHPYPIGISDEFTSKESLEGKLVIATFNSTKGMERKCVFVMNFDESYFKFFGKEFDSSPEVPNIIYVALTRAIDRLYVVKDEKQAHFRTVDTLTLHEDAKVYGFDKLKRGDDADNPYDKFVVDLVKHRSLDDVIDMLRFVKQTEIQPKGDKLKVNGIIEFPGYCEDVNMFYGTLIPILAQHRLQEEIDIGWFNLLEDLDKRKWKHEVISSYKLESFVDVLRELKKLLTGTKSGQTVGQTVGQTKGLSRYRHPILTLEQWMKAIVWIKAIGDRCHFYYDQISKFDWIDSDFITQSVERLIKILPTGGTFEQELEYEHSKKMNIVGAIDYYLDDEIWEFKCVGELCDEHVLQCAAYICLRYLTTDKLVPCKLYNVKTDQLIHVEVTDVSSFMGILI